MRPDEPDDADRVSAGADASGEPDWSVEDFDDFEDFDANGDQPSTHIREGDAEQSTFDLESTATATSAGSMRPGTDAPSSDPPGMAGVAPLDAPGGVDPTPREDGIGHDIGAKPDASDRGPGPGQNAPQRDPSAADADADGMPLLAPMSSGVDAGVGRAQASSAAETPSTDPAPETAAGSEDHDDSMFDDTVEGEFQGGETASADVSEDEGAVGVPEFASFTSDQEFESFTSEDYIQTTTQEFVDLASDMARMSTEEHVPSAVAAEMPGLQVGVVGLDDVVAAAGEDPADIPPRQKSDLALRVFTGVGLAVIFFASLYAPLLVGLFVLFILLVAAFEFYGTLVRSGYHPVGFFGVLGIAGALIGTWIWGPIAIPISISATLVVSLLYFAIAAERRATLTNTGLTVLGAAWIGGLGAFIFDMARSDLYGWMIVATVVTVSLMDVAQYFFGRRVGRHRLAPRISPNKTVEGLVGGVLVALIVGVIFGSLSEKVGFLDLKSPIDLGAGLALGLAVAVAAPFGDLAVSLLKRSIGVKDMGTVLPGHGGLLDRVDAMLFAIPLAWIVFVWTGILA